MMLQPSLGKHISFRHVALKGRLGLVYVSLFAVMVLGFGAGAVLVPITIPDTTGEGVDADMDLTVPSYSGQPVKVRVSHVYTLRTTPGSDGFLVDGVYDFDYSLTVFSEGGEEVAREDATMSPPGNHEFSKWETVDTATMTKEHGFTLQPGKYTLTLASNHPVDVVVVQRSLLSQAGVASIAVGVLCAVVLAILTIKAIRKRDELRKLQLYAAVSPDLAPSESYYNPSASHAADPTTPALTRPPPAAPPPSDPRRSTLEYVSGQVYAEILCLGCGQAIRNPPINGIVTCEHCGDQAFLG